MNAPVLGIDLGTTNSVVAVMRDGRPKVLEGADGNALIPSVVSFKPDGEVIVGRTAKERRLLDAANTIYSVKRLIGRPFRSEEVRRAMERFTFELQEGPKGGLLVATRGEKYTLSEISAFVLRQVRSVAERALGEQCTRAVLTVPASFNELQRSATKAAGGVAGLEVLRILNEPTAAALAYGLNRQAAEERVAIFDLGGGTFDLSILDLSGEVYEVVATAGDSYLGGDDIDLLVADQMSFAFLEHHRYDPRQDPQAFERLRAAAEWAKIQLSEEPEVQLRVEELAYGPGGSSLDLTFELTRDTLDRLAQPLLARSFDVCEDAMKLAGMRPSDLDAVILVGGATRMPLVQRMVREYFGRPPLADIDPDLVVAKGAAVQARALSVPRRRGATAGRSTRSSFPAPAPGGSGAAVLGRIQTVTKSHSVAPGPPPGEATGSDDATRDVSDSLRSGLLALDDPAAAEGAGPPLDRTRDVRDSIRAEKEDSTRDVSAALEDLAEEAREVYASSPPPGPHEEATRTMPPGGLEAWESAPGEPGRGDSTRSLGGGAPELPGAPVPPPVPPPFPESRGDDPQLPEEPSLVEPLPAPVPLLLDVTPMSLGIETVGGYCEAVVRRNAAIPVEHSRIFSTGRDGQQDVRVRIYQGESRRLEDNQGLGSIELTGLRSAPRGAVQIEVAFLIDADGTLDVRAKDLATGKQQTVRINLIGGLSEEDVRRMQDRQAAKLGIL